MSVSIFFCYAHEDEALLKQLKAHLIPLQREKLIDLWYDRDISAGTEWEKQISQHLNTAQIILLLVSPDFMASDYIYSIEMKRALERDQRREARVIPIILRRVYWQGILGNLQALPTDAKPVRSWPDLDEALYNVTEGIRKVVVQFGITPFSPSAVIPSQASKRESADVSPTALAPQPIKPLFSIKPEEVSMLSTITTNTVTSTLAISPDGQTLASGSADGEIKLWHLATGEKRRTLSGHAGYVYSVAFSPDGQTLASCSEDAKIKLWHLATGQELRTLRLRWFERQPLYSLAISPDGQTLASGSSDNTIKLWNLATGQELHTLKRHTGHVYSVAFSPDGQTLASGSRDKTIKLWNLVTEEEPWTLSGHTGHVLTVAISPDGQTLASGSHDGEIKLWNLATGEERRTLKRHTGNVYRVAISPDGQTLASGSRDKTIKLWNLATGQEQRNLTGHTKPVSSVAFSPDGQTLVSGSVDGTIKIWGTK